MSACFVQLLGYQFSTETVLYENETVACKEKIVDRPASSAIDSVSSVKSSTGLCVQISTNVRLTMAGAMNTRTARTRRVASCAPAGPDLLETDSTARVSSVPSSHVYIVSQKRVPLLFLQ